MWTWLRSAAARLFQGAAAFLAGFFLGVSTEKKGHARDLQKKAEARARDAEAAAVKPDSALADELRRRADGKD